MADESNLPPPPSSGGWGGCGGWGVGLDSAESPPPFRVVDGDGVQVLTPWRTQRLTPLTLSGDQGATRGDFEPNELQIGVLGDAHLAFFFPFAFSKPTPVINMGRWSAMT